jgi:hypothetical protein
VNARVIAIAIAACASLATYLVVTSPGPLLFGLLSQAIFILPGVLMCRAIAPGSGWLPAVSFGPFVGQALGSLVLTMLWVAGARGPWLLLAAPILVALLIVPARRMQGRWTLPQTERTDIVALAIVSLIVPLLVAWPFAHVGEITPGGQAYRAYFTADYVWRRAVVLELAKGAAPLPVNPYFAGDVLHYYWMPHLLPAVQYRFAEGWASLDELLLIHSISIDLFFVAFLYGMARTFRVKPWAAAGGVVFAIVASSLEGAYVLFDNSVKNVPLSAVKNLNIDAVSRWYFQGIPIDGLQRLLFYQPHHAVGYVIGLIGLLALATRQRARDAGVFAVAGVCLALSVVISSFAGLMVTAAAALYELVGLVRARDVTRGVVHALAAGIPLGIGVALVYGLGYVDTSGQVLQLGINRLALHDVVWVTVLSCGPIIGVTLLAIPALATEKRGVAILGALAATSVAFYFFVNVRDHQDVYVGWRVGHFMFIAAAVVIGMLLEQLAASKSAAQPLQWAAVIVLFLAGLPTTLIDVYNTQDISEHGEPPYWTLMLRADELQAFDWIKKNTRPEAVFQVDPIVRQNDGWAYLPAFAARRMAVGFPISMVPLAKYQDGSAEINRMFDESPLAAYERAAKARINYVLIGPPERMAHPGVEERFASIANLLPVAFKNGTISIYEVR